MKTSLLEYLRQLLQHAENKYSIASFVLALVLLIVPQFVPTLAEPLSQAITTFGWILLVLTVVAAPYFVWRDALTEIPTQAKLSIRARSCRFAPRATIQSDWFNSVEFWVDLDLINQGADPALLQTIQFDYLNVQAPFIGRELVESYLVTSRERELEYQDLPLKVAGRERLSYLTFVLKLPFNNGGLENDRIHIYDIVRCLHQFESYSIELTYHYEDMSRLLHADRFAAHDDFEEFKQDILDLVGKLARTDPKARLAYEAYRKSLDS